MLTKFKANREQKKLLKAIKKNPSDSTALVLLGWHAFNNLNFQDALGYFTQALEAYSDVSAATDAAYGLALIDLRQENYQEAEDRLRRIVKEQPDFQKRADVHLALGEVNERLWRTTAWKHDKDKYASELLEYARDHYEQALERKTTKPEVANFSLGKLLFESRRREDALAYLQNAAGATTLEKTAACEAYLLLGRYFLDEKQDETKAQEFFETAVKKGPKQDVMAELQRRLGNIARKQGNDDLATQRYEQSLTAYREAQTEEALEVLVNLSELKFQHHWLKIAIGYAERGMQIPTESKNVPTRLLYVLARANAGIKEYNYAAEYEQQYFKSTKEPELKAESLRCLGQIYEHQEQMKSAIDAYRKGLKFVKRNLEASKLNAALGRLYLHEGRLNQASNHLKEAAEFAADDAAHAAGVYRKLGECHLQRKETERAIEAYGKILADYSETMEEPVAREALKTFRKQLKKQLQDIEHALKAEDMVAQMQKAGEAEDVERLLEIVDEMLDEKGFFERLKEGLSKTHMSFVARIEDLLSGRTNVDEELIENLEEALILSDIGVSTSQRIIEHLQESVERKELADPAQIKYYLKREVLEILQHSEKRLDLEREKPFFILVIGVNGTGKTTTIGKMASQFKAMGKEVLLVAGDTFRAAAIEQLEIWGERTGCEVIKHASGADPSAVMYDAVHAAKARQVDVVIADTAGRLHTKKNLMEELKKMVRVISREMPGAPHETLMVIDATTGQNAISQANLFHQGVGLSGLVLTKLDGTAKGGIIAGIANDLNLPVTYIGIGEQVEDLREFHAKEFVDALFEN